MLKKKNGRYRILVSELTKALFLGLWGFIVFYIGIPLLLLREIVDFAAPVILIFIGMILISDSVSIILYYKGKENFYGKKCNKR